MSEPRDEYFKEIKKELFGPSDSNSEEILYDYPSNRYFCGVLYPGNVPIDAEEGFDATPDDAFFGLGNATEGLSGVSAVFDLCDEEENDLSLSTAFKQSALSMDVAVNENDVLTIEVSAAIYLQEKEEKVFVRKPIHHVAKGVSVKDLLRERKQPHMVFSEGGSSLYYRVFPRWKQSDGSIVLTVSLVNGSKSRRKSGFNEKTFFQASLVINSQIGFAPFFERLPSEADDYDSLNNALLYRDVRTYAVGHGCSPMWSDSDENEIAANGVPKKIESSFFPWHKLKAVVASANSEDLSMRRFSLDIEREATFSILDSFCKGYSEWIKLREDSEFSSIPLSLQETARQNLQNCRLSLARMRRGVEILKENENAFTAFRLMNRAMLLQQIRSKVPSGKQILEYDGDEKSGRYQISEKTRWDIPDPDHFTPIQEKAYGHWRAFQLGFILLTIESMVDPSSEDRGLIDLIWFPTGGGKTEAYLGLTAFTLIYNRLLRLDQGDCVQVFMRYSLRLLTSQQYQRAASLICALEFLRRKGIADLGEKPFSIGLWVGGSSTPNTGTEAVKAWKKLNEDAHHLRSDQRSLKNPFIITRCPWCGAEMGVSARLKRLVGYSLTPGAVSKKRVVFSCDNPDCEFHAKITELEHKALPLKVVDEDIYEAPPSLLIGTVDKFAIIPFMSDKTRALFGLAKGAVPERSHPQLVIQDELHLITGPLGSAVACYETMFDVLCSASDEAAKKPKIVASTATISQAATQCRCLFAVLEANVRIFPSPCLDANETYFSRISTEEPGREYVGVFLPASSSSSLSSIHFLAAALASKKILNWGDNAAAKDAYWTNVCYFNAIRELAQATTWELADVREQEARILKRVFGEKVSVDEYRSMEMNSRNGEEDVSSYFAGLNTEYSEEDNRALDLVYTTNMFSVGVDIDRLGLMTVFGQPKTASEYIQATSRVGRKPKERPGLVFTLYNPNRPRDKSIFENFKGVHSKLYAMVEPMSVTPFSPTMRKKALPALIIGIASALCTDASAVNNPSQLYDLGWIDKACELIVSRVSFIDPEEVENARRQLERQIKIWIDVHRIVVCRYPMISNGEYGSGKMVYVPAIVPDGAGDNLPPSWRGVSAEVPTSMRSVDQTCIMQLFNNIDGDSEE